MQDSDPSDYSFLLEAYKEAELAYSKGEVPIGAVIVRDGLVIARAHNLKESLKDTTAHAELLAIKNAQETIGDWRLNGCVMYTTLEPCPMCAGAILHARLDRLVYGAPDLKWGAVSTKVKLFQSGLFNHVMATDYLEFEEGVSLLQCFFKRLRDK